MPPVPVGWDTEPRRSVGAVRPRRSASRRSPPRSTSPASRRSRCRCTGPTTGLPIGVQLVGPPLGEALLLRIALAARGGAPVGRAGARRTRNIAAASVLCDDRHMDTPPLPSGTVTFVFTDIESSTDLVRRLGTGFGSSPGGASQRASVRLWRNTTDTRSIRPATGSSPHSSEPGTPLPRRLPRSAHSMHPSASRRPCVCAWAFIPRSLS